MLRGIAPEHQDAILVNYDCDVKTRPERPIDIGLKAGGGVY